MAKNFLEFNRKSKNIERKNHADSGRNQIEFDKLFRSNYKNLFSIAYGYTKDYNLSNDLVQDVFLDVWKRRESIKIKTSVTSFLKRAIVNQALTAIKNKKIIESYSIDSPQMQFNNNAQRKIEFNELNSTIESIVGKLPNRCREVFMLSRTENLSHKEIAKKLEISVKTIENQITKALKLIEEGLKKENMI